MTGDSVVPSDTSEYRHVEELPDVFPDFQCDDFALEGVQDCDANGRRRDQPYLRTTEEIMLPNNKNEFPKCIYLDQNKWIDLARAFYGRDDGKKFQGTLEVVKEAGAIRVMRPFYD